MPRNKADRDFPYYPAFLDLRHKRVVVVGGGTIATGKVEGLLPCGPEPLVVVAPKASRAIRAAAEAGHLEWIAREYAEGDLVGADLAFGATDDRDLNARVAAEARCLDIPVLAVDDIPNCDFIAPSLVKRGNLTIAMSTGGRSPAMARWIRERLDETVPAHWATLLEIAAAVRAELGDARRQIPADRWQEALNAVLPLVEQGDEVGARERLIRELTGSGLTPDPSPAELARGEDVGDVPTLPSCSTTSASANRRAALSVSSSGSPGPAPTR